MFDIENFTVYFEKSKSEKKQEMIKTDPTNLYCPRKISSKSKEDLDWDSKSPSYNSGTGWPDDSHTETSPVW